MIRTILIVALFLGIPAFESTAYQSELKRKAIEALAVTNGTLDLKGVEKPVTVYRDTWGIPHIYAASQKDLFVAQGYVAAQDRLWQLDIWRRTGEGKLSEILGPSYVERDKFARLLKYRGDMEAEYRSYAPDAKEIIESFVKGVNEYIDSVGSRLPIEFQIAGIRPEHWTPETCLTRMAGYVMTRNASTEVLRAQLVKLLGKEKVEELIDTDPHIKLTIPEGLDLNDINENILKAATAAGGNVNFKQVEGSNNWVINGKMSVTGKPILANDPHRTIGIPSLRYMVHLVAPGWNVIGAGEPGLPGVAAGHNERIGFGFTIVGTDQQDLFVEETNPENPSQYKYKGRWIDMKIIREPIRVKGENDRTLELKYTRNGPVVYEDAARHRAYSLKWVGTEPGTAGYLASLSMNRAQNWKDFLKSLERWKVPSENIIYADVDGNIGWVAAGLAPIRRGWDGVLPVPGASGKYEWIGFRKLQELPSAFNPQKGYVATANNNIMPSNLGYALGYEWAMPYRVWRIEEVLREPGRKFSVNDFEVLQHDVTSLPARELQGLLKGIKDVPADLQPGMGLLTNWDCVLDRNSASAALYEIWLGKLAGAVFRSRLPEGSWPAISTRISLQTTIETLKANKSEWFGNNGGRDRALLTALREAINDATKRLGSDMSKWRWGTLHQAVFNHSLSGTRELAALLDVGPVERSGDPNTVNATGGAAFKQTAGASFREILDVSDWDNSVAINVPGQSAQPQSKHYSDLLPLWAEGRYFPWLYTKEKVEKNSPDKLVLMPAR